MSTAAFSVQLESTKNERAKLKRKAQREEMNLMEEDRKENFHFKVGQVLLQYYVLRIIPKL
jgi:hypothetical protein